MSSSLLPPPPPPPTSSPPPGPPPAPPPPPPTTNTSTANYLFGFVITFIVLLLVFVGCGVGSWRRFRLIGTAWDEQLQDMEGSSFTRRKRGRRRLVRPVFLERSTVFMPPSSEKTKWIDVQPISAAFVWSRSTLKLAALRARKPDALTQTPGERRCEGSALGMGATLRSYVFSQRSIGDHPPRRPTVERPPPEAIQVAVMIAMPSSPSLTSSPGTDRPRYVGQPRAGEYQIGVVRIPWS